MDKPYMVLMVGNIASGKTTWIRSNDYLNLTKYKHVVLSRDSLRRMIGAGEYIYDGNYEPLIKEILLCSIAVFMSKGVSIVIDETNLVKAKRKIYLDLAKKYDYQTIAVVTPRISKEESLDRRMKEDGWSQSREDWDGVWEGLNKIYEKPSFGEGFDSIEFL